MKLGIKQAIFARRIGRLIDWAFANGYLLTFGEAFRPGDPRNHGCRLAVDLNLRTFNRETQEYEYRGESEAHRPLGERWKLFNGWYIGSGPYAGFHVDQTTEGSEYVEFCWGGDFLDEDGNPKPDGNHYSILHQGVK